MEFNSTCGVCQKDAHQKCGGCHVVYYCSKEHQKLDWKVHKLVCKAFEIREDAEVGRHLVASRNLKVGDVILKEPPLIWGPQQTTIPVCLGCGKGLSEKQRVNCVKCGWPMCSEICQNSPSHIPECSYTVSRGDKVCVSVFDIPNPTYQCIFTLRCLYHKQFLPDVWKKIENLESHCEDRKKTPRYQNEKITVAAFVRKFFKLAHFSEEEILRICGILMINAHEVPLTNPPYIAIFEKTSMFEHNCRANCSKTFTSKGEVLITAGLDIKKGDHLSICYTDALWGTINRRHHLYESKFFWCKCERCSDPTEFGTYFSCIKCSESKCKGFLVPKTFLGESSDNTLWYCNKCGFEVLESAVHDTLERCGKDLQEMPKGSTVPAINFIARWESILGNYHHYLIDVKFALCQLFGQENERFGLFTLTEEDLQLKVKACKDVIEISEKLAKAENRIRGVAYYELHAAIAEIGKRKGEKNVGPDYIFSTLMESKKILEMAVDALRFEPQVIPEGMICNQAKQNLKDIERILKTVSQAVVNTL